MISYGNLGANITLIGKGQVHGFSLAENFPHPPKGGPRWFGKSSSVSWLPMYHDMGLVYMLLSPLSIGARMYYMSPITFLKDPCSWIRCLARYNCNWAVAPDFGFHLAAKKWDATKWTPDKYSLKHILYMHNAAEPIREKTISDFNATFRPYGLNQRAVSAAYGLAESVVCVGWCVSRLPLGSDSDSKTDVMLILKPRPGPPRFL